MVRENFKKDQKTVDETAIPKFGAGSEFGREQREEARKRRYGNAAKKSDPDEQPWLMRIGNKKVRFVPDGNNMPSIVSQMYRIFF